MKNVVILGYDYALATSITGLSDLLSLAGVSWNRLHNSPNDYLTLKLLRPPENPLLCLNSLKIMPHVAFDEIEQPDIVLVPTIWGN